MDIILVQRFKDYPEDNVGDYDRYMSIFHNISFPLEEFLKWLNSYGWDYYEDSYDNGNICVGIASFSYYSY